jgi:hypothetical protein
MKKREFTFEELLAVTRFLRDTPLLSLVRTIVKARWLRWYDKTLAEFDITVLAQQKYKWSLPEKR